MDQVDQNEQSGAVVPPIKNVMITGGYVDVPGDDPLFVEHAKEMGRILGERKLTLLFYYNGNTSGIFGAAAESGMTSGAPAIAIMEESAFQAATHTPKGFHGIIRTPDFLTRHEAMWSRSDSAIILPGDIDTLADFFSILNRVVEMKQYEHRIFLMNSNNFYGLVIEQLERISDRADDEYRLLLKEKLIVLSEPRDIIPYLPSLNGSS